MSAFLFSQSFLATNGSNNGTYWPGYYGNCTNMTMTPEPARIGTSPMPSYVIISVVGVLSILWAIWHAMAVLSIPIATFGMETGARSLLFVSFVCVVCQCELALSQSVGHVCSCLCV